MKDILDRIADSSPNESSHELICRLRDCAREIEALRGTPNASQIANETREEFALKALVAAGHVSQEKVDRALTVADKFNAHITASERRSSTFQSRVRPWMMECFGAEISADRVERNHRFFEEASELVQACGMTASEAHQLVDYTWSRPIGEPNQEAGGVMVTLAALCLANGLDMHAAGETELARISAPETMTKIRAKQAVKPKYSPLAEAMAARAAIGTATTSDNDEGIFRLACEKNINLEFDGSYVTASHGDIEVTLEMAEDDPCEATREAVSTVAVQIGGGR